MPVVMRLLAEVVMAVAVTVLTEKTLQVLSTND
jgi:hypothetical protein